jgi:transcriptional regulator with XRE-family HTH domain
MTKPQSKLEIDRYIGARIREGRLALNLSQEQLARALGVSFQQIQNYENGVNGVSAVRLFDICRALNVPLAFMFPHETTDPFARPTPADPMDRPAMPGPARVPVSSQGPRI